VSYSIDVNILIYASDQSDPRNTAAIKFMRERTSDSELFCITWHTIMSYLRISTHPSIFSDPLAPDQAPGNVESLISLPHVRVLFEKEGFFRRYRDVAERFPVRGNLVPDAHLASILRQHGVRRLYTNDRDFKKFDFLDVRDPFV